MIIITANVIFKKYHIWTTASFTFNYNIFSYAILRLFTNLAITFLNIWGGAHSDLNPSQLGHGY